MGKGQQKNAWLFVHTVLMAGFLVPQKTLDDYEIVFLGVILPLKGRMWFQTYIDASRGN